MSRELKPIDVSEAPELLRIAEEVHATGESRLLTRAREELAILTPVRPTRRPRKTGIVTKDDPIWGIVGIGESTGPTDVSANKYRYLAEAYAPQEP